MNEAAMASFKHQGLCKLAIVPAPETIRELGLPEHAADVVVAHRLATGRPGLSEAFVFEVQLRPDRDKWWTWPIHLCGTRARHRCPATLVVITTNERTARWAARPIDLGRTQGIVRPLVIGPRQIPRMLELHEARACPELATLAVIVHGHRPGSKRLGRNALEAVLERLAKARERDRLLLELVLGSLPAKTLREIEDEMDVHTTPLLSKWSKQRVAEGRALGKHEGRQQALILVLGSRGLVPTAGQLRRIKGCAHPRQLDAWLRRAATVESVAQLFRPS